MTNEEHDRLVEIDFLLRILVALWILKECKKEGQIRYADYSKTISKLKSNLAEPSKMIETIMDIEYGIFPKD